MQSFVAVDFTSRGHPGRCPRRCQVNIVLEKRGIRIAHKATLKRRRAFKGRVLLLTRMCAALKWDEFFLLNHERGQDVKILLCML